MDNPADVGLVDSHAESNRCAHYLDTVVDEVILSPRPVAGRIGPA